MSRFDGFLLFAAAIIFGGVMGCFIGSAVELVWTLNSLPPKQETIPKCRDVIVLRTGFIWEPDFIVCQRA